MTSSLKVLLARLVDYAGLYPPAGLSLDETTRNYECYLRSTENWMLNRLILPLSKIGEVIPGPEWRVSLLADKPPGVLPDVVEVIETKSPTVFELPVYREMPLADIRQGYAKIRTGGTTPDAIPDVATVAQFLIEAADRHLPFKATAGLHHPIRKEQPLTYAADSPRGVMHGFINVFVAAAFAWNSTTQARQIVEEILAETDPGTFHFADDHVSWKGERVRTKQVADARQNFAHSFGSCSFEEPVADLKALGWL